MYTIQQQDKFQGGIPDKAGSALIKELNVDEATAFAKALTLCPRIQAAGKDSYVVLEIWSNSNAS
jgi:hypothetical protein